MKGDMLNKLYLLTSGDLQESSAECGRGHRSAGQKVDCVMESRTDVE